MSINIACAAPSCNQSVIGQCTGYQQKCGRYYCHEHSSGTLCAKCNRQKVADEHAERVFKEYLALAEKLSGDINKTAWRQRMPALQFKPRNEKVFRASLWSLPIGIILVVVTVVLSLFFENTSQPEPRFWLMMILALFIMTGWFFLLWSICYFPAEWLVHWKKRRDYENTFKQKVLLEKAEELDKEKPGFLQFWQAFQEHLHEQRADKKKKALMGALAVAGIITAGVLGAALSESDYQRTRRAVRDELRSR